ncbi:hypothetical protein [Pseudomonas rossensis]|uniref:hypothetical protein n=1 Tax=Pseudomonas rossensis TaxID=2305471 RepID=UPI00325FE387
MNEQEFDIIEERDEDFSAPQDGFLGPRRQYLSVQFHFTYSGTEEWATLFSVGMATDAQKEPLVAEICEVGSPLNIEYFINAENLELWINGQLGGLCRYRLSGFGDQSLTSSNSDEPEEDEASIHLSLLAVFIRPQYRSKGLGNLLSTQLAEVVASGLLNRILGNPVTSSNKRLTIAADLESSEGEAFFENLTEELEIKINAISAATQISIDINVDSGY